MIMSPRGWGTEAAQMICGTVSQAIEIAAVALPSNSFLG